MTSMIVIVLAVSVLIGGGETEKQKALEYLEGVAKKCRTLDKISYEVVYGFQSIQSDSIYSIAGEAHLINHGNNYTGCDFLIQWDYLRYYCVNDTLYKYNSTKRSMMLSAVKSEHTEFYLGNMISKLLFEPFSGIEKKLSVRHIFDPLEDVFNYRNSWVLITNSDSSEHTSSMQIITLKRNFTKNRGHETVTFVIGNNDSLPRRISAVSYSKYGKQIKTYEFSYLSGIINPSEFLNDDKKSSEQIEIWTGYKEPKKIKILSGVSCSDMDGEKLELIGQNENLVLLNLWYIGCLPCAKAIPFINALWSKYQSNGLSIYGVNCFDSGEKINKYIAKHDIKFKIVTCGDTLAKRIGNLGYPTFILLNSKGEILLNESGFASEESPDLILGKIQEYMIDR